MAKLILASLIVATASGCWGAQGNGGGPAAVYASIPPHIANPNDMRFWSYGQKSAFKRMMENK